jgi:tRNA A-37 threonylcarbamoyl transferase component Bud32
VIGTTSERPTAAEIAAALSLAGTPIVEIRRVPDGRTENRRYTAVCRGGDQLDVTVFDRDQQAADFLYRLYRRLRLTSQASRSVPLTVSRAVERRALMAYAVEDAGVPTPKLLAALRVGPEAAAVATRHCTGTTLADLSYPPSDQLLGGVWDAVLRLHRHRVTHRSLTPDHILVTGTGRSGRVMLLDPGDGDVAASDLQIRLDLAQLTAAMALLVGPERAASLAKQKLGEGPVRSLVPLLQPVVLHRSTRASLRRRKDVLPALRRGLLGSAPEPGPEVEQLERIRPRSVVTLVAAVIAAYLVIGQLGRRNFLPVLRESEWRWVLAALAFSAITYAGASWSLSGFVLEKLRFSRTFLAQLAGTFVTLVAPA